MDHSNFGYDVAHGSVPLEPEGEVDIVEEKRKTLIEEVTDRFDGLAPEKAEGCARLLDLLNTGETAVTVEIGVLELAPKQKSINRAAEPVVVSENVEGVRQPSDKLLWLTFDIGEERGYDSYVEMFIGVANKRRHGVV